MSRQTSRGIVAAAACAAILCLTPSLSHACLFEWCSGLCGGSGATTYAPPHSAQRVAYSPIVNPCNPCDPCAAPAVNYAPQVKYRWTYKRIARTSYRPVATCDPCTGCPTTVFRPVTTKSLLPWIQREAYTTYQPAPVSYNPAVCNPCNPCATVCDPCGGTITGGSAVSSGCASCVSTPSSTTTSDPGYSTGSGQTFAPGPASGSTYPGPSSSSQPDLRLKPLPDAGTDAPQANKPPPRLTIPAGRTALLPVRPVVHYQPIIVPASLSRPSARRVDTSGWRPAAD